MYVHKLCSMLHVSHVCRSQIHAQGMYMYIHVMLPTLCRIGGIVTKRCLCFFRSLKLVTITEEMKSTKLLNLWCKITTSHYAIT